MIVISNRSGKYTFVLSTNNNNHVLIGEKKLDSYHYTGLVFFTYVYVIFQGFFLVFRSKSPKGTCYRKKNTIFADDNESTISFLNSLSIQYADDILLG